MKRKILIMLCFGTLFCTLPLFSQVSNTFLSTGGTIRTYVDDFMDVRYFNEIDFEKDITFIDFSGTGLSFGQGNKSSLGYLSTYYKGNLWEGISHKNETENTGDATTVLKENQAANINQFDLLFGWKNLGFKLENLFKVSQSEKSTVSDKNNSYDFNFTFGGLTFPVWRMVIKPQGSFGFGITDQKHVNNTAAWLESIDTSDSHNSFSGKIATDFEFGKETSFFFVTGLGYSFYGDFYPDGVESITTQKDVDTREVLSSNSTIRNDKSDVTNSINSFFRFEATPFEKFKFGGMISLDFNFINSKSGSFYDEIDNKQTGEIKTGKPSFNVETYTFELNPEFGLGLSFSPSPYFTFNLGYGGKIPGYQYVKKTEEDKVLENDDTGKLDSNLTTGFVWNMSENCSLDVTVGLNLNNPSFEDVWKSKLHLSFGIRL